MILHSLNILFQTGPIELWAGPLDGSNTMSKLVYPIRADVSIEIISIKSFTDINLVG